MIKLTDKTKKKKQVKIEGECFIHLKHSTKELPHDYRENTFVYQWFDHWKKEVFCKTKALGNVSY